MIPISQESVLAFDVGGSHVSAAVCFEDGFRLGPEISEEYPAEQSTEAFVDLVIRLGDRARAGMEGVGGAVLAFPGPFDFDAGISRMQHKLPYLFGKDLRGLLAGRFQWRGEQVRFLHDAGAFLLGEVGAGAARRAARAAVITLGTGIGSAFAIDGHLVFEGAGVPPGGEIWNLPFEGGIVEDSVSSRAIRKSYERLTGKQREVAALAAVAATDASAREAFAAFGRHLGLALRRNLAEFAPAVVVLGGGIARSAPLFMDAAAREVEGLGLELRVSELMGHAPLVGAGVAWFNGDKVASSRGNPGQ